MRPPAPLLPLLLALAFLGPLAGCGGGDDGLRIDVEAFSFDGDLPEGLSIRRVLQDGRRGAVYDLEPVPGGRPGEYRAPGAPDGAYVLEGPPGWWMLQEGGAPAMLARDLQPPLVGLGRGRSVYLGSQEAEVRPSDVWGAVRILPDGGEEPVPVTAEADERGYVAAIRFAREDWRGTLQVVGRVALGPPPTPSPGPEAPLSEPVRFDATGDGAPVVTRLRQAATEPLTVVLVAASNEVRTDGVRVRASLEGVPVPTEVEAFGRGGVARFASIPLVDRVLRLQIGDEEGVHRVDPVVRRRQANVRVLVAGQEPAVRALALADPEEGGDLDVDLVLVRPQGAVAYGRVPLERVEGGVAFPMPRGGYALLLRSGSRWSSAAGFSAGPDGPTLHFEQGNLREGVVVGGSVDGAKPGTVVRFFLEVGQEDEAVLGDGFEVRVEPSGTFEARLPVGRYLVEVATRTGTWRRPAPLVAESEGARLHVPLESP